MTIPFNKPYVAGNEINYIKQACERGVLSGNGPFTKKCQAFLQEILGVKKSLLTHSCTAALEMAAILIDIQPGDEIIMPSYTFVSTANAFVLRGGVPVFVDIRADTLNIDEEKIEAAITEKTKAIVPVHYAGVACEMDAIMAIAKKYNLYVVEDAAQGIMSTYNGKLLGSIGHLAALSFHETKNIISGEGGALLINDSNLIDRAEIIREKGTDREKFFRGQVDKYSWVDIGSSYLPSELTAAFLYAQFEQAEQITKERLSLWDKYHQALQQLENDKVVKRPFIPAHCNHNGHMYYLLLNNLRARSALLEELKSNDINAVFHYVPLHDSKAGRKYSRKSGELPVTNFISDRILRLPFWLGMERDLHFITDVIYKYATDAVFHDEI